MVAKTASDELVAHVAVNGREETEDNHGPALQPAVALEINRQGQQADGEVAGRHEAGEGVGQQRGLGRGGSGELDLGDELPGLQKALYADQARDRGDEGGYMGDVLGKGHVCELFLKVVVVELTLIEKSEVDES